MHHADDEMMCVASGLLFSGVLKSLDFRVAVSITFRT